jgi:hypothetical protein
MTVVLDRLFERRKSPRIAGDLEVTIHCEGPGVQIRGEMRDLSLGGICVATREPFAQASAVRLDLKRPRRAFSVGARGLWQRYEPGEKVVLTGFAFEPLGDFECAAIGGLLSASLDRIAASLEKSRLAELGVGEPIAIAELVRFRRFRGGHVIYDGSAPEREAASNFVVEQGRVSLHLAEDEARTAALGQIGPGEIFGGLCGGSAPPHEVAIADCDTRLFEIDRSSFEHVRERQPALAFELAAASSRATWLRVCAALLATVDSLGGKT